MAAPLVVEVTRGSVVESRHEVDVAVIDPDESRVAEWGDRDRSVLPRSALKPIQAVPLVESGAADALGVSDAELAIACGSHGGEPHHIEVIDRWLTRLGLDVDDLECGAHAPFHEPSARALAVEGLPFDARHNNCSGKHCGFLCLCAHLDLPTAGYIGPGHPLQADHISPAVGELCGVSLSGQTPAIDGCGIPVWSIPLDRLAVGWARLGKLPAGSRLLAAMTARPDMVAGTDQACTRVMTSGGGRVAVKTGAEGVYCAVDLESGRAVALKARDGATRAAEAAIGWVLSRLGAMAPSSPVPLRNWAGTVVGQIRVRD